MPTPPDDILPERAGLIAGPLTAALCGMVGFRNAAVHPYEDIDMSVLRWVVESGYHDWIRLGEALVASIHP